MSAHTAGNMQSARTAIPRSASSIWANQRERGSRMLLRAMLWTTLRFGWGIGRILLHPITWYFFVASPKARAASRDYLGRVLGRPPGGRDVLRHFFSFALVILDRVFLLSDRLGRYRIEIKGLETITAILERGEGCVLLGAHFGSFDVLRAVGRAAPVRVRPLMYRAHWGATTRLLEALDPALAGDIIEIGHADTMLHVQESVARGEIVGVLADRAPDENRVVEVPFLGSQAAFPTGPFVLAGLLEAPVVLFYGMLVGPSRYLVRFEPFADRLVLPRTTRERDLYKAVARYAASLESASTSIRFGRARSGRRAAPVLMAMLLMAEFVPGPAAWADAPDNWLGELMGELAAIPERHERFGETKYLAVLNQPLVSQGWLNYRRPAHLEKITTAPQAESLLVDGDRLTLTERSGSPQTLMLASHPEITALVDAVRGTLSGDLPELERHYRVVASGGLSAWRLVLWPADRRVQELLRDIVFEGTATQLRSVRTDQTNGDTQIITVEPAFSVRPAPPPVASAVAPRSERSQGRRPH